MTMQIRDMQLEREATHETNNQLLRKVRTYECIIKTDILEKDIQISMILILNRTRLASHSQSTQ